ncbi:7018_t:CDS:2 [Ambispora leptoticha]|uniref:7018_t:CDS:1 n=1 Tax=Ambispora leptoticha TaxID=144679 RepID=A0A9N8Z3L0_9GLOM|nr:7018_t:CDS:2 [Ambispora leptoticha]
MLLTKIRVACSFSGIYRPLRRQHLICTKQILPTGSSQENDDRSFEIYPIFSEDLNLNLIQYLSAEGLLELLMVSQRVHIHIFAVFYGSSET